MEKYEWAIRNFRKTFIDAVTYSLGTCHSHLCWECLFCLAQLQATHSREQRHIHFSITKLKGQE